MSRGYHYTVLLLLIGAAITGDLYAQEGTDDPARLAAPRRGPITHEYQIDKHDTNNKVIVVSNPWHGEQRVMHYRPDGEDFVCVQGRHRFNRALYGTNTAFRVEAGDLPEFALYMPGMGGNWKFGVSLGKREKWLSSAEKIKTTYRPGSMIYEIRDTLLGNGTLSIRVLALADAEGMIIEMKTAGSVDPRTRFFCAFGGASGKKFSRDGDLGADPESSFDCKPEYCTDNRYTTNGNRFELAYGSAARTLEGSLPPGAVMRVTDAGSQDGPLELWNSTGKGSPMMEAEFTDAGRNGPGVYFVVWNPGSTRAGEPGAGEGTGGPDSLFARADKARQELAGRVVIHTPDPYINTLGGALAVAGDAIWESPSYLHGAVAWRMRLPGWRGPYVADPLGWHDRARTHFSSYALSQVLSPESGPVIADTNLRLARQLEKLGTSMFSEGYICRNPGGDLRPNHYDMNLVYIDELLDHFFWTGDTGYVRKMWPVLQRHLAWERRNFDVDGDGLYDAYCCIWASDALQYCGGGVTHSSSYNYRANHVAADLAVLIGEDPKPYRQEAAKILHAINTKLWMPSAGWYAEYIDRLARIHPAAGLWTIYHSIDSDVPDPFQAWESLRYVDTDIPHIPVDAVGLKDKGLYTLSTTNWQPYTWSINNVVLAECLHTALACWQGGRPELAWPIWKGALVESMYLGGSPGNFQQLSFYDAARGELYRDFADPIGVAARSLVEGLFGIHPDALHDTLTIHPGWPADWREASLRIPDISMDFRRNGGNDAYTIQPHFTRAMNLVLELRAEPGSNPVLTVNGRPLTWMSEENAIGGPMIRVEIPSAEASGKCRIQIQWRRQPDGANPEGMRIQKPWNGMIGKRESDYEDPKASEAIEMAEGGHFQAAWKNATIDSVFDPQLALDSIHRTGHNLSALVRNGTGNKTIFIRLRQGSLRWWHPVCLQVVEPVSMSVSAILHDTIMNVVVKSHRSQTGSGVLEVDEGLSRIIVGGMPGIWTSRIPLSELRPGMNSLRFVKDGNVLGEYRFSNWHLPAPWDARYEEIDLAALFNDRVTNIFRNKYLSPRPAVPTLQLPIQGIGNWCYPLVTADVADSGLRAVAGEREMIYLPQGVPLQTPGTHGGSGNIIFTSRWSNYPDSVAIPLRGRATHAYFLMAGSTDPMQSQVTNGMVEIRYKDGTIDSLPLVNPSNWWPIEQDYYVDGSAFTTGASRPLRVSLKTGLIADSQIERSTIKGFTNMAVPGGSATVLDMPLNPHKNLDRMVLRAEAEDVVIGLMSFTLLRN